MPKINDYKFLLQRSTMHKSFSIYSKCLDSTLRSLFSTTTTW